MVRRVLVVLAVAAVLGVAFSLQPDESIAEARDVDLSRVDSDDQLNKRGRRRRWRVRLCSKKKSKRKSGAGCSAFCTCASGYWCKPNFKCAKIPSNYQGTAGTFTRWAAFFAHDAFYYYDGASGMLSNDNQNDVTADSNGYKTMSFSDNSAYFGTPNVDSNATLIGHKYKTKDDTQACAVDIWAVTDVDSKTYIFVAFAGTLNTEYSPGDDNTNFWNDLHAIVWVKGKNKGSVQTGNYYEVKSVKSWIQTKVKSYINYLGEDPEAIVFTGHSQGGAQSELAALWTAMSGLSQYKDKIRFVAFNPTKVGDKRWTDRYPGTIDMDNSYEYISWHMKTSWVWYDRVWELPDVAGWYHPKGTNKRYIKCSSKKHCHTHMMKRLIWKQA